MLKNKSDHNYINMDDYYLNPNEYTIILNRCLDYDLEAISLFKEDMRQKIAEIKQNKVDNVNKYCRGDDINLTVFIREVCSRFYSNLIEGKATMNEDRNSRLRMSMFNAISARQSNLQEKPAVDIEGERNSMIGRGSLLNNKRYEREMIVDELKTITKETNAYKSSSIKMLAFMKEMDRIFSESKTHINKQRNVINSIRSNKMDQDNINNFHYKLKEKDLELLNNGSKIVDIHTRSVNRALATLDEKYYQELNERRFDYCHVIKNLQRNIDEKINGDEYKFIHSTKDRDLEGIQSQLKKRYEENPKVDLADYLLLETTYKHILDTRNNELKVKNLVNTTFNQVIETINNILAKNGSSQVENVLLSVVEQPGDTDVTEKIKKNFADELCRLKNINIEADMIKRMSKFSVTQLNSEKLFNKPDTDHTFAENNQTSSFKQINNGLEATLNTNVNDMANFLSFQRNINVENINESAFERKAEPVKVTNKSITDMNAECEDLSEGHAEVEFNEPKTSTVIHSHIENLKHKRMSRNLSDANINESKATENLINSKNNGDQRISQSEVVAGEQAQEQLPIIDDQLIESDVHTEDNDQNGINNTNDGYDSNADGPDRMRLQSRNFVQTNKEYTADESMKKTFKTEDIEATETMQINNEPMRRVTLAQMTGTGENNIEEIIDSEYNESVESMKESEVKGHGEDFLNNDIKLSKIDMEDKLNMSEEKEAQVSTNKEIEKNSSFKDFKSSKENLNAEAYAPEMLLSMEPVSMQRELRDPYSRNTKMVEKLRPKLNSVSERSFADTNMKDGTSFSSKYGSHRQSLDANKKDIRELSNPKFKSEVDKKHSEVYNSLNSRLERSKRGNQIVIPSNKRITNIEVSYDEFKKTLESYIHHPSIKEEQKETLLSAKYDNAKITEELTDIMDTNNQLDSGKEDNK